MILDFDKRRESLEKRLHEMAANENVKLQEDVTLLDEVTGLVEWPVVLKGAIDPQFMSLPEEVLITPCGFIKGTFPFETQKANSHPRSLWLQIPQPKIMARR